MGMGRAERMNSALSEHLVSVEQEEGVYQTVGGATQLAIHQNTRGDALRVIRK